MSTVFRNLNEASTVLWNQMGALLISCLAESQVLVKRISHDSDTAVALRRGISIFPCLTIVFIHIYNEYFCKMMWLSAISPDVFGSSERNAPMYTEIF